MNMNIQDIYTYMQENEWVPSLEKDLQRIYDTENKEDPISISTNYMIESAIHNYLDKNETLERRIQQVAFLQTLELPEQRSKEWYELRKKVLTASSLATAIGDDHFKSRNELIRDKLDTTEKPFVEHEIMEWGVKYEEIATRFYALLTGATVLEFGLIPHPAFPIFGASPDGICSQDSPDDYVGRMLEIKCPPKRKFTKSVPKHYWYQMQGQLECCDLDECDFLQVKLVEYESFEDYKKDVMLTIDDRIQPGYGSHSYPKGPIVTYRHPSEPKKHYLYPPLCLSDDECIEWVSKQKQWIEENQYDFVETKWWYIERYECTLVHRDKQWWLSTVPQIINFWNDVEHYRKIGIDHIPMDKKKVYVVDTISKTEECLID
jgi:putative phage-type endonuclease